jgi:hypothetical protein
MILEISIMSKEISKAVTARFPQQEYLKLLDEAEQRGTTIADIIRTAWSNYQQQTQLQQTLLRLEQRQRKVNFEMLCTITGLQPEERQPAITELQSRGVKW